MAKFLRVFILLILVFNQAQAQPAPKIARFKPSVGFAVGTMSYSGDLDQKAVPNPFNGQLGYELTISKSFTDYLNLTFMGFGGKMKAENKAYQTNFQATIKGGAVLFSYNFGNLLPDKRDISPFIAAGFESFEFITKSDLRDQFGNRYFYWSDGSIRNMAESSPDKENSVVLTRDYLYESDLREANLDGFGKYTERSYGIPVSAGFMFHINERVDFKIGTTMHFALSDYIDNVTQNSVGIRQGNKQKDRFLMTNFGLTIDIFTKKDKEIEPENNADFLALETADEDKDGIIDYKDNCPFTPQGVAVDSLGCPLDKDGDHVPDYKDKEPESAPGAIVSTEGIALTDSIMERDYLTYVDSTGQFAPVVVLDPVAAGEGVYVVMLGSFKTGVPSELINKYLNLRDVNSALMPDSMTTYYAGRFPSYDAAYQRLKQVAGNGIDSARVGLFKNGIITPVGEPEPALASAPTKADTAAAKTTADEQKSDDLTFKEEKGLNQGNKGTKEKAPPTSKGTKDDGYENPVPKVQGTVYRVQIGAYKRKVSRKVFGDIKDLFTITNDNGITKYLTGTFTDYKDAAKHKVDMVTRGYQGAFIVAFKDGERVTLESTGVNIAKADDVIEPQNQEINAVNKELVVFKVQLGVFKNEVPAEIQAKFNSIKNIEKERTPQGLTRYSTGTFSDYNSAVKYKNELIQKHKLEDAFVISFFKDRLIDVQEAIELLK